VVVVGGLAAVSGGPALGWHWCRWAGSGMEAVGRACGGPVAWCRAAAPRLGQWRGGQRGLRHWD
jgi:hypothetical protein